MKLKEKDFNDVSGMVHHKAVTTKVMSELQKRNGLLFFTNKRMEQKEGNWYELYCVDHKLITKNLEKNDEPNSSEVVEHYRKLSNEIYRIETSEFELSTKDGRWLEGTIEKGTLKDRIASMSVTASQYPLHRSISIIDKYMNWMKSSSQSRIIHMACEALQDLYLHNLLPPSRTLFGLESRPLLEFSKHSSPKVLFLWRFEELVKLSYKNFIEFLASYMNDYKAVDMDRIMAIRTVATLLTERSESEKILLPVIVNKIGDPTRKVANRAILELKKILNENPIMDVITAREVQQLINRPHLTEKALYNCIVFLNQLNIQHEDFSSKLPSILLSIYFSVFDTFHREFERNKDAKEMIQSHILGAVLKGVNRVHSYVSRESIDFEKKVQMLYKIVHFQNAPMASVQALLLLFHLIIGTKAKVENHDSMNVLKIKRFYRALYSKIDLMSKYSSKSSSLFFHAAYISLKYDINPDRITAISKKLLKSALYTPNPGIACTIAFLLSQIGHGDIFKTRINYSLNEEDILNVKREPDSKDSIWEITLLRNHYHPSVVRFATDLIQDNKKNSYRGNPLIDFSIMHFLDKFAYRQPKKVVAGKKKYTNKRSIQFSVNNESFLQRKHIDGEHIFFFKYFTQKNNIDEQKKTDTSS